MNWPILIAKLPGVAALLLGRGFHKVSPFFLKTFGAFLLSGKRQLVLRVGRRGGKSSSLCLLAVVFALYGKFEIPLGDVGIVGIVSTTRDEAASKLRTIAAILDALHVRYRRVGEAIELEARPIIFKTFAATVAGVPGGTWIFALCDEVARWKDADTGQNPATEVLASLRPCLATQKNARIVLSSSPLGHDDAHARAFEEGDDDYQMTAFAPTWVANPSLSEQETHELEKDLRIWSREYAAIPQAGKLGAFDVDAIDRAFRSPPAGLEPLSRAVILDPSSGKKDSWTWGTCGWSMLDGQSFLVFDTLDGLKAGFWRNVSGGEVVERIAAMAHARGIRDVHSDQRESMMLSSDFTKAGLSFFEHVWTPASKVPAVEQVRRLFADGRILLPPHDDLRRELLAFEERFTPSGAITFAARGNGHDDYVALLITAMMSDLPRDAGGEIELPPPAIRLLEQEPIGWPDEQFGWAGETNDPSRAWWKQQQPQTAQEANLPTGPLPPGLFK